jgi:hypothetical protein
MEGSERKNATLTTLYRVAESRQRESAQPMRRSPRPELVAHGAARAAMKRTRFGTL